MKYQEKRIIIICISILFILLPIFFIQPVIAQEDESTQQTAEMQLNIADSNIPNIEKKWTTINLTIHDNFGINWDLIKTMRPRWFQLTVWRVRFRLPDIVRYLGYTSILFEPDLESIPDGWSVQVEPSTISKTTAEMFHTIKLLAQVNELASEYNPTIRIKCTRFDALGDEYGVTYATIPLKAVSLNYAFVNALETSKKASPKTIVYFPIEISNQGEYIDTYNFEVKDHDGTLSLISQQAVVLNPGEETIVKLGVLTPELFFDVGTPRRIDIIVYPTGSPSEQFETSVIVITEGFYLSPLIGMILIPIIILLIIIYFIFFYLKQKKEQELFGKPQKPWNIPIERKHLEELKQKDKEAYEKERLMMEDEYKSAMLWYDSYRQSIKQEKQIGKSKQLNLKVNEFFKKPENKKVKPEKKKEEKQPKKEKKPEKKVEKPKEKKEEKPKETPEIVKEQYKAVQKRSAESERRKQIALEKIKRAQEKQKGKIKK